MDKKLIICAGLLLVLSACTRDIIFSSRKGGEISFRVSSCGAATKTVYSGDRSNLDNGTYYERLDWESGDMFALYCDQAAWPEPFANYTAAETEALLAPRSWYATPCWLYTIDGNGPDNRYDKTTATGYLDRGLVWDKTKGTHHFFAVYPADVPLLDKNDPDDEFLHSMLEPCSHFVDPNEFYADDLEVAVVTVPYAQKVYKIVQQGTVIPGNGGSARGVVEYHPQPVPMAAYAQAEPSTDENNPAEVKLSFSPLLTTLRIELRGENTFPPNKKLTMLELISDEENMAGDVTVFFGNYATHSEPGTTQVFSPDKAANIYFNAGEPVVEKGTGFLAYATSESWSWLPTKNSGGHEDFLYSVRIVPDGPGSDSDTVFPNEGISLPTGSEPSFAFTFLLHPYNHSGLYLRLYFGGVFDSTAEVLNGEGWLLYTGAPVDDGDNTVSTATLALKYSNKFITLGAFKKTYIDNVVIPYSMVTSVQTGGQETREYTLDDTTFNQTWEQQ